METAAFELTAPPHWRALDFLSDLHLQATEPATLAAFERYLQHTSADGIFILGDLFEVWVGDDAAEPGSFEAHCGDLLREASSRRAVFFIRGNRDFLIGSRFLNACGAQDLPDPTVLSFGGQRWLLSHGDALCLDDTEYQRFRAQVRSAAWQEAFLTRALLERQAMGRAMREASTARQNEMAEYADVDTEAAKACLIAADATTMIHGHTHRPAEHALGTDDQGRPLRRVVLSDWHFDDAKPRADVLQLNAEGLRRLSLAEMGTTPPTTPAHMLPPGSC